MLIVFFVALWIGNILFCSWLAKEKNRKPSNWVILAIFLGFLSTIALAISPAKSSPRDIDLVIDGTRYVLRPPEYNHPPDLKLGDREYILKK